MDINVKKVIITGATGFIGEWLVKEMIQNNVAVTVIVREREKLHTELKVQLDIIETTNYDEIELQDTDYDVFYHLAWAGVAAKDKNNIDIQFKNIPLAVSAMRLADRCGCKKFIMTGTIAEYTMCDNVANYARRQTPSNFYGAAKVAVFYTLEVLSKQLNMPFIWALLSSTYGEGRYNENIIVYTIKELLTGRKPLYGSLNQMWGFLYISDMVNALRLIGESGIPGKTYGVGSGEFKLLKEYILQIRDMINPNLELGIGELPVSAPEIISSCVATYDLIKDTGFKAKVGFEEGIARTIEYYKKELKYN